MNPNHVRRIIPYVKAGVPNLVRMKRATARIAILIDDWSTTCTIITGSIECHSDDIDSITCIPIGFSYVVKSDNRRDLAITYTISTNHPLHHGISNSDNHSNADRIIKCLA